MSGISSQAGKPKRKTTLLSFGFVKKRRASAASVVSAATGNTPSFPTVPVVAQQTLNPLHDANSRSTVGPTMAPPLPIGLYSMSDDHKLPSNEAENNEKQSSETSTAVSAATLHPSSSNVVKLGCHVVDERPDSYWNKVRPSQLCKPEDSDIIQLFRQHSKAIYNEVDKRFHALNVITSVSRNEIEMKGLLLSENKNSVVYFIGDIAQGLGKIGSTGNGRVRASHYHEQNEEGVNVVAAVDNVAAVRMIDIDNFDPETDQVIQRMIIDLAKRFSFSPSQLPATLDLGEPDSNSLPSALKLFMHSLVYNIETSPQLGGGKEMKGFLKGFMRLVLEVGTQEAYNLSHHNHSMQEFLGFDHEAYNIHMDLAKKLAMQIYDTLISVIGKERLQAISCHLICIMSWRPRIPKGMIETTPLLESTVHGKVLYDVDTDYQNCDPDAEIQDLYKRMPRGKDPYQPDYQEWEKANARESLKRVLLECDKKGGAILNIDSNRLAFPEVDVIEDGKVVGKVLGVAKFLEDHGYKLVAKLSAIPVRKGKLIDTLQVYVKDPPNGGGLCVAIVHPPWCRLADSNQRYHVEPMESCQVAIMAEGLRKFHQLARTGVMTLKEDKQLFSPNIVQAYGVKEFFVKNLHMNPMYANTILKSLLSQYNALSSKFHQMTKRESDYVASNNRNYEAKALKKLKKDPDHFDGLRSNDPLWSLTVRRILSKATDKEDLDLYAEQAVHYIRCGVPATTASRRFAQIKKEKLISGDLLRRFEEKYEETKRNAGNTSNHRGQSLFQIKSNDIFIHEKVKTGEAFWVKYKDVNSNQEEQQVQWEPGQIIRHENTNMPYFFYDVYEKQYKCLRFMTNPGIFFDGMIYSSLCKNYFRPKKQKQNNTSHWSCRNYSGSYEIEPLWTSGNVPLVINNYVLVQIVPKLEGPSAVSSRSRKGANDRRFLMDHAESGKPFWIRRPPNECSIGARVYDKGEEILDRNGNTISYGKSNLCFLTNPKMDIFDDIYPISGMHYKSLRTQNFVPANSANRHVDESVRFYGTHTLETKKDSCGRLVVCNNMVLCWIKKLPTKQDLLEKKLSFFDCQPVGNVAAATAVQEEVQEEEEEDDRKMPAKPLVKAKRTSAVASKIVVEIMSDTEDEKEFQSESDGTEDSYSM